MDRAPHQFHELPGDGQAQAGALLRSWPAHLHEWLEDTFLILRGYAGAGVLNLKPQQHTITGMFGKAIHPQDYASLFGVLQRVADQIDQYVPQYGGIRPHR